MARKKKSAKRSAPKAKKYAGKTEDEWKEWGEEFGKQMEKLGESFGRNMEKHGKRLEKKYKQRWDDAFGFIGPLIRSIIGIFFLIIGIWILNAINFYLTNSFISLLTDFLFTNIPLFFWVSLFFGYCNYFSRKYTSYWIASPVINSLNAIFVIWILSSIFIIVGVYTMVDIIANAAQFLLENLIGLFFIFVLIGYISELSKRNAIKPKNF